MKNWLLKYVDKGYNEEKITYLYIGAISNILENKDNNSAKEQIKRLNELQKYFNETIESINSKS